MAWYLISQEMKVKDNRGAKEKEAIPPFIQKEKKKNVPINKLIRLTKEIRCRKKNGKKIILSKKNLAGLLKQTKFLIFYKMVFTTNSTGNFFLQVFSHLSNV